MLEQECQMQAENEEYFRKNAEIVAWKVRGICEGLIEVNHR
jgi:hypothetical protein